MGIVMTQTQLDGKLEAAREEGRAEIRSCLTADAAALDRGRAELQRVIGERANMQAKLAVAVDTAQEYLREADRDTRSQLAELIARKLVAAVLDDPSIAAPRIEYQRHNVGALIVDVFTMPPGLVQLRVNRPEAIGFPVAVTPDELRQALALSEGA